MANEISRRIQSNIDKLEDRNRWIDDEVRARSRDFEDANKKARELSEDIAKWTRERGEHTTEIGRLREDLHKAEENERSSRQ